MTTPEVQSLSYGYRPCLPLPNQDGKAPTYFKRPAVQYLPLTADGDIEMEGFLNGCRGVVEFIGFLGSAFSPVKNDVSGNICKVERVYQTDPERYATVKKLLDAEIADWPSRMGPATESLMWLKRALEFFCIFLDLIVLDHKTGKRSSSLVPMAREAYDGTLKKHHKKLERGLFKVMIHATPNRKELLKTIASGRSHAEDDCIADIEHYLALMRSNVGRLVKMYQELGFENDCATTSCPLP